jgi:hypothetical protein
MFGGTAVSFNNLTRDKKASPQTEPLLIILAHPYQSIRTSHLAIAHNDVIVYYVYIDEDCSSRRT